MKSRRNITDEQMKAAAGTGGLVGMVGFPSFVSASPRPTLDEFVDHIDYAVGLVGDDHVGLGLDYYRGQAPVVDDDEAMRMYEHRVATGDWRPESYPPPPHHFPDGIATPREFRDTVRSTWAPSPPISRSSRRYARAWAASPRPGGWTRWATAISTSSSSCAARPAASA